MYRSSRDHHGSLTYRFGEMSRRGHYFNVTTAIQVYFMYVATAVVAAAAEDLTAAGANRFFTAL